VVPPSKTTRPSLRPASRPPPESIRRPEVPAQCNLAAGLCCADGQLDVDMGPLIDYGVVERE
jgi:hypothetical protein